MEFFYKTKKLAKVLNSSKLIDKSYGKLAKKLKMRLDDMAISENLEELMALPGRHHPLTGSRKGQFACDLEHPFRLVYEPANEPLPTDKNDALIYKEVSIVGIIEVTDYH